MSSPTQPIAGPIGPSSSPAPPAAVLDDDDIAFLSELVATEHEVAAGKPPKIVASRATPPPEVLEQMAGADEVNERLRRSGRRLRFLPAGDGGPVTIELRDGDGALVRTLTVAEALDIAMGKPLG